MIFNTGVSSTDGEITRLVNAVEESMTQLETNVQAQINELTSIIAGMSVNTVKSVQRGEQTTTESTSSIPINPVNPDKSVVLLSAGYIYSNGTYLPRLVSITESEFTITRHHDTISWQVIEFY